MDTNNDVFASVQLSNVSGYKCCALIYVLIVSGEKSNRGDG